MSDETAIELIQTVASLKTTVDNLGHQLFGNGQPGLLERFNTRLKDLEDTKQRGKGILWALGSITSLLSLLEALHLVKKGA